ncbi:MAG TPA: hypothetical protein VN958_12105, partial [Chitinophagaceae bacterium]|nr:hypothetical protein [Chitinophagaceae bacterium]
MTNIGDLHIQQEILPLFDFTQNNFSREELFRLLGEPLASINKILLRQGILKGFISNLDILKDFSYSRIDFCDVHNFLCNYSDANISKTGFKLILLFLKKDRHHIRGKFTQLVSLFYRLQTNYFQRINTKIFPEIYKRELQDLNNFLASFNLTYYERLIRKNRIKIKHIIKLTEIISSKVGRNEHTLFWQQFFLFEAYLSIGKAIAKHGFSFPTFTDRDLSFKELYHPLIKQSVKNSLTINSNVILLTGPNMSGKSTFLKAVGLSVYLGHIGLGVPAVKAEIPYFDSISIAINLNDNILSGYSHFMSEVKNLKQVVTQSANSK